MGSIKRTKYTVNGKKVSQEEAESLLEKFHFGNIMDGAMSGLDKAMEGLDKTMDGFDRMFDRADKKFDKTMESLDERVEKYRKARDEMYEEEEYEAQVDLVRKQTKRSAAITAVKALRSFMVVAFIGFFLLCGMILYSAITSDEETKVESPPVATSTPSIDNKMNQRLPEDLKKL